MLSLPWRTVKTTICRMSWRCFSRCRPGAIVISSPPVGDAVAVGRIKRPASTAERNLIQEKRL